MADGKKFRRKKCPTILSAAKHNPIAYNNMKSNFSPTPNVVFLWKIFFTLIGLLLNLIFEPILSELFN